MFEDARLRVLDVNIPPGVTTLDHSHDHDLVTVSIGQADTRIRTPGADWGAVRPRRPLGDTSTVEYAGKQGVHTIQNVGPDPYRLIAVENVKQSGWHGPPAVAAPGVNAADGSAGVSRLVGAVEGGRDAAARVCGAVGGGAGLGQRAVSANRATSRAVSTSRRAGRWSAHRRRYRGSQGAGEAHLVEIEVF